jgi:hypothetical protein
MRHYIKGETLVLGEGDFTFAGDLARRNRKRGQKGGRYAHITATSLDSAKEVRSKYKNIAEVGPGGLCSPRHCPYFRSSFLELSCSQ